MRQERYARLAAIRDAAGLDAVALVPGANFYYLTGGDFHLMERPTLLLLARDAEPVAILPSLEVSSFETLGTSARILPWQDKDGYQDAFRQAAGLVRPRRIGVEGQRMRVFEYLALARAFPEAELIDAHAAIAGMRLAKDEAEIALLRRAIEISEQALARTLQDVRIGMTEIEVKAMLTARLHEAGAEGLSFEPIVLAADNSARPHGHARADYRLKLGDALLFDFGARVGGYNADVTRTVFLGRADDEARAMYDAVLAANAVGRAAARAGRTAHEVDDAVQRSLEATPFAEWILTKTGHGLGLEVHEAPYLMRGNHQVLDEGAVATIEPGLYRPGYLGIRIEDDVVVRAGGGESLTRFPRELTVVG